MNNFKVEIVMRFIKVHQRTFCETKKKTCFFQLYTKHENVWYLNVFFDILARHDSVSMWQIVLKKSLDDNYKGHGFYFNEILNWWIFSEPFFCKLKYKNSFLIKYFSIMM